MSARQVPGWFVGVLIAALAAACHGGSADASRAVALSCHLGPVARTPVKPIRASTPQGLEAAIERQLGGTLVRGVLTTPPPGAVGHAWMKFPVSEGRSADAVERMWQALLVAVVYRDQAAGNDFPPIGGTSFAVGAGALPGGPRPNLRYRTLSASSLACLVERNATALHARVTAITMLHVQGLPVPEITVRISSWLANRSGGAIGLAAAFLSFDRPVHSPYLASLVQVQDASGSWVQSLGMVPASGRGTGASAPKYDRAQVCGGLILCTSHG
jgi:hypothetical protein